MPQRVTGDQLGEQLSANSVPELVAHMNPAPRGFTGAGWVTLGALLGLIVIVGTLLALAWLAV